MGFTYSSSSFHLSPSLPLSLSLSLSFGKKKGGLKCPCKSVVWLQIYFLPDSNLSSIPFAAFKVRDRFMIERVPVAQASSLGTLDFSQRRWQAISSSEPKLPPEVGMSGETLTVLDFLDSLNKFCNNLQTSRLHF